MIGVMDGSRSSGKNNQINNKMRDEQRLLDLVIKTNKKDSGLKYVDYG